MLPNFILLKLMINMSCWCKWRILQKKKKSKSGEQKWRVTFMRWSDFIFTWGFAVRKIEGSPDCSEPIKSRIPSIWLSGHLGAKVTCRHQWPPGAARAQLCHRSSERFLFNKNSGLKFWNFTLWMEQYNQLNWSDPSHWMFGIGCRRAVLETTILSNGKGQWNDQTGQSGPSSKGVAIILVGPNMNGLFHLISKRNFHNFELNGKH